MKMPDRDDSGHNEKAVKAPSSGAGVRKRVFAAALALAVLAAVEGISYVGVRLYDRKLHMSSLLPAISNRNWAADVYQNIRLSPAYDPEIGSDIPVFVRNPEPFTNTPLVSVYGDSFTFAQFVETEETWPYIMGEKAGVSPVLNMGKPGYGLDQTLMKIRKYYDQYPSKIVVMGFVPMTIQRNLAMFMNYYYGEPDPVPMTKPRYTVKDGMIEFIPNYCNSYTNMLSLLDKGTLRKLSMRDYWYLHDIRCYGYDRLAENSRKFPYAIEAAKLIWLRMRYPRADRGHWEHMYGEWDSEGMVIMRYLLDKYAGYAGEKGFIPVVLVNCMPCDFDSSGYMGRLLEYARGKGLIVVNAADMFNAEMASGRASPETLYGTSHYSPLGNRIVAEKLAPLISLLKDGRIDEARAFSVTLRESAASNRVHSLRQ